MVFLTNHARVLLHLAHDPGARLRDIAASPSITERRAHGIITDLAGGGYVITQIDGRQRRTCPAACRPSAKRLADVIRRRRSAAATATERTSEQRPDAGRGRTGPGQLGRR